MAQVARMRVFEAYTRIESGKGWKSFIQRHCRGAILDYLRGGEGFEESNRLKITKKNHGRLRKRVQKVTDDGDDISVEALLGMFGVYSEQGSDNILDIRWELVARMARVDTDIHLVAKLCLGFTQTELSSMFQVSRERLTQRLQRFCKDLESPEMIHSKWTAQTIYAFGLSEHFNERAQDLGFGWEYDPVDLQSRDINYIYEIAPQMHFRFVFN